jgi:hypothetical protein
MITLILQKIIDLQGCAWFAYTYRSFAILSTVIRVSGDLSAQRLLLELLSRLFFFIVLSYQVFDIEVDRFVNN